jgi:tagatose-1,6-bisphosphate aldolase non-catalytic subunit AgaZ/GatZ
VVFRDDHEATLARLEALDARVAAHDEQIAERDRAISLRDARIAELEAEVVVLRKELIEREAMRVDGLRRPVAAGKPIVDGKSCAVGSPEAREEAARLLAEGVERYHASDRQGATACFERGLMLVPGDPALLRALRRYT